MEFDLKNLRTRTQSLAMVLVCDVRQSLYREVQLALRAVIGGRELDSFLTVKDDVAQELEQQGP